MPAKPSREPDAKALLNELIGFNTVSSRSNLDLIGFIGDYLAGHGIQSTLIRDESSQKADLLATIGPNEAGGVLLAGHTDVVPVENQDWSTDPFAMAERDGHLYGRGTCDMKGFIAVVLAAVPSLAKARLNRPIHLGFTYDEEIGCFGGQAMARHLAGLEVRPAMCIVGEPTSMTAVNGHKGKLSVDCRVHGAECHSAFIDKGVNAVEVGAEIVTRLRAMQKRIQAEGPFDDRFDPPFTTIQTGLMGGGIARNIVPRDCSFEFEIRNLPEQDTDQFLAELKTFISDELLPEMQAIAPASGITLDIQSDIPALLPDNDSEILKLALQLTGANAAGHISFATEAGLYQGVGIPTIVCGPGDIAQAHRPDEFVALDQLSLCADFLSDTIAANERLSP
jgi:acetylornithine deacetylase